MEQTGGIVPLIASVAVFLFSHSLTNLRPVRARAESVLGRRGFVVAYSVLSVLLLGWMIAAFAAAPIVPLWDQQPWMRWVPPLAMPVVCVLWLAGMTTANPFSIGPGGRNFDPSRPGIVGITRHPVLWGLALWAGAHIVPNGDVAALMLFVPLLLLALVGPAILDAKRRRTMGAEVWRDLALRARRAPAHIGGWRVLAGLALYGLLILLHPLVIGANPLP